MTERISVRERPLDDSRAWPGQRQVDTTVVNVCLLGASFDTGNLGVSALAESSVKCILTRWPAAHVTLLASGRETGTHTLRLLGRDRVLRRVPVRFCKNVFLSHHYVVLFLCAFLVRLLPWSGLKARLARRSDAFKVLLETDLFVDIAGGDSFSDIYGMRRLTLGFLTRLLPLLLKKDLVMFPQTYGPFARRASRLMARFILKRTRCIYARDHAGLDYLRELLGGHWAQGRVQFAPDVAFVLDSRQPEDLDTDGFDVARSDRSVVAGINVSGLIYYGGYTGRNEFGLKVDYQDLVDRIIELFLADRDTLVLLVPHVVPMGENGGEVENDLLACLETRDRFLEQYPGRLFVARGRYDQAQVKHVIGKCDFFVGTRMHSCIAALSQGIPAVGLAYSKKFAGVFATAGVEDLVVDMRSATADEAVAAVERAYACRQAVAERLRGAIPGVQQQVATLLQNVDSCGGN